MRCPGNSLKGVVVHLAPREGEELSPIKDKSLNHTETPVSPSTTVSSDNTASSNDKHTEVITASNYDPHETETLNSATSSPTLYDEPTMLIQNPEPQGSISAHDGSDLNEEEMTSNQEREPYEEYETPPAYDQPPPYAPDFAFDPRDKYHYSLAQRNEWALDEPGREGSPHWDNLTAKNPSVMKESRAVKKYRRFREQQATQEESEPAMEEILGEVEVDGLRSHPVPDI